jgi:hypothetical protein
MKQTKQMTKEILIKMQTKYEKENQKENFSQKEISLIKRKAA